MNLDFSGIKDKKTVVGGVDGKVAVKLVGFTTKLDSNGNPNYQFKLEAVEFDDYIISYNCGESFYKRAVSNIGAQLGFDLHKQKQDVEILTKATKEVFNIWIQDGYTNFYERETIKSEEAPEL